MPDQAAYSAMLSMARRVAHLKLMNLTRARIGDARFATMPSIAVK